MLIEKIKTLLDLTKQRSELEKKIKEINEEIDSHQKEGLEFHNELGSLKKMIRDDKKHVSELEIEISSLVEREQKLKKALQTMERQRDIDSAKKEILGLQDSREEVETELLVELENIEGLQSKFKEIEPIIAEKISLSEHKVTTLQESIDSRKKELDPIIKLVEKESANLPDDFKSQYNRISTRLPQPIVSITDQHCGSCYTFIAAQEFAELKKKQIGTCKNCSRILFVDLNESPSKA